MSRDEPSLNVLRLRKKLELLKKEYERTALKLQRAERLDAIRRRIWRKRSDHNRLPVDSPEPSTHLSSLPTNDSSQNVKLQRDSVSTVQLPLSSITFPPSSLVCKQNSAHRLRSKRSRLRLQNKDRDVETGNLQEKGKDKNGDKLHEQKFVEIEKHTGCSNGTQEAGRAENHDLMLAPAEKKQHVQSKDNSDSRVLHNDGKNEKDCVLLYSGSQSDTTTPFLSSYCLDVETFHHSQENNSSFPLKVSVDENVQLNLVSKNIQTVKTSKTTRKHTNKLVTSSPNDCDGKIDDNKPTLMCAGLDSCTLVEGLPFPVEYYVRTTRRMAASQSSIDLDAVIYSQLNGGRGRRRLSQSQTRHVTQEHQVTSCKSVDQQTRTGKGPKRKKGRSKGRKTFSKTISDCTGSCPENESFLDVKSRSHMESSSQSQPVNHECAQRENQEVETSGCTKNLKPSPVEDVVPHFPRLPDSCLSLDTTHLPDSQFYSIFRRRDQIKQQTSLFQIRSSCNDASHLPSLASLIQTLCDKDWKSGLLAAIQEFHLPDEDFGKLKTERLRLSASAVDPLVVYNTRRSCRQQRLSDRKTSCESDGGDAEVTLQPLYRKSGFLQDSLALSQPDSSVNQVNTTSSNPTDHRAFGKTEPCPPSKDCVASPESRCRSSETETSGTESRPLENSSPCPAILNLSPSLTSHTQRAPDPALPSLGITPQFLTPSSAIDHPEPMLAPSDILTSPTHICGGCLSPDSVVPNQNAAKLNCTETLKPRKVTSDNPVTEPHLNGKCHLVPQTNLSSPINSSSKPDHMCNTLERGSENKGLSPTEGTQINGTSGSEPRHCPSEPQIMSESAAEIQPSENTQTVFQNKSEMAPVQCVNNSSTQQTNDGTSSCSALQEIHTFKALEEECVVDLCWLHVPSGESGVCVAGERSAGFWVQDVFQWRLLHTWTFTEPVVSLQVIPDSSGLLYVTLGHLKITETRILCCGAEDLFSQTVLSNETLQAVVGVSNCRVVCCSIPGDGQKVCVATVTQEGRVGDTFSLIVTKQSIVSLAAVERENDALIGWTECRALLIWNMKSRQLVQTVNLDQSSPLASCLRGYSFQGVLCVLLQNTGNVCDEENNALLFTLMALNPLTGKRITLTSIDNPDRHIQQLMDGDVYGSRLVAVFRSGYICVWDLTGSVAKAAGLLEESCRVARWAGPDTLLTGFMNGDVSVFHYKSARSAV